MIDFAAARRMMVDGQVRTADVTDPRILSAMLDLPREQFFPEDKASLAYLDRDVPVSEAGRPVRRLLKPMVLAKLIQAANLADTDHVLDVGCATGYSTAVLGRLARSVVGLEEDAPLARQASEMLAGAGVTNAKVATGALAKGWPAEAPYDVILLEGATETVPAALVEQLKIGGRLACVLGRGQAGKAMVYRRAEGDLSGRAVFDAAAPLLPGFAKPPEFVF
ncbi:MAG: protein-L-isoaspartate O-methyltransferase [Xanthobacteraceae bacterium]|nr:protein-L-isoaspartate O-methyltransferase [Xanthobacteraceae bacterium]